MSEEEVFALDCEPESGLRLTVSCDVDLTLRDNE